MIELAMVNRMLRRGVLVLILSALVLAILGGGQEASSGALGVGMALLNLWVAGRIIGGIAENAPHLLMPAALASFVFAALLLTVTGALLQDSPVVDFKITGVMLVASHLLLVTWEAAGSLLKIDPEKTPTGLARGSEPTAMGG
ncbi:MAG: hypothetical protein H0U53_04550 [Actinobacteria bacterium]|nr:hypothetical protein [Actinomycetota bacterium]